MAIALDTATWTKISQRMDESDFRFIETILSGTDGKRSTVRIRFRTHHDEIAWMTKFVPGLVEEEAEHAQQEREEKTQ